MWDAAIVEFPKAPSLDNVMDHFGGIEDKIGTTPVLRVADDSYIVRFRTPSWVLSDPAIDRWSRTGWPITTMNCHRTFTGSRLRGRRHGSDPGDRCHRRIDSSPSRERLAETENTDIKNAKIDTAQVVKIMSSLKGVMLGITFGKQVYGKIRADFGEDVTPLAPYRQTCSSWKRWPITAR